MSADVVDLAGRRQRRARWACNVDGCVSEGRAVDEAEARLDWAAHHYAKHLAQKLAVQIPADVPTVVIRDRSGDLVDVDARDHDQRCDAGWLGEDIDGNQVPCMSCKPHLAKLYRGRPPQPVFRHEPKPRTSSEDVPSKGRRLLAEGRVHLLIVTPHRGQARVRGDSGTYLLAKVGDAPWSCTGPVRGRGSCSHVAAVHLVTGGTR